MVDKLEATNAGVAAVATKEETPIKNLRLEIFNFDTIHYFPSFLMPLSYNPQA